MLEIPEIIDTKPHEAAVIRLTVPRPDMPKVMHPAIEELLSTVKAQGIGPIGPMFAHHLTLSDATFDFEVGFPVSRPVEATGRVKAGALPGGHPVVHAAYVGPYEGLPKIWGELMTWIERHGHAPGPTLWEVYSRGPESGDDPSTYRTDLYRPLANGAHSP